MSVFRRRLVAPPRFVPRFGKRRKYFPASDDHSSLLISGESALPRRLPSFPTIGGGWVGAPPTRRPQAARSPQTLGFYPSLCVWLTLRFLLSLHSLGKPNQINKPSFGRAGDKRWRRKEGALAGGLVFASCAFVGPPPLREVSDNIYLRWASSSRCHWVRAKAMRWPINAVLGTGREGGRCV